VSDGNWRRERVGERDKFHALGDDNGKPIQKLYTKSYIKKCNARKEDRTIGTSLEKKYIPTKKRKGKT